VSFGLGGAGRTRRLCLDAGIRRTDSGPEATPLPHSVREGRDLGDSREFAPGLDSGDAGKPSAGDPRPLRWRRTMTQKHLIARVGGARGNQHERGSRDRGWPHRFPPTRNTHRDVAPCFSPQLSNPRRRRNRREGSDAALRDLRRMRQEVSGRKGGSTSTNDRALSRSKASPARRSDRRGGRTAGGRP